MNEREIKLCKMSNAELGLEEINRITNQVAEMKRAAELITLLKDEQELLESNADEFINKHGFKCIDAYDVKYAFHSEYISERIQAVQADNYLELVPESFFRYRQFYLNKFAYRNNLREVACDPKDETVSKWRKRQINRCNGAIGGTNLSLIHSLFCFEIACGCSVGCEFCGLGAKRLSSLFRYTDENARLFREVMTVVKNRFGSAGATGMLYYATEPLDNPDYEMFERDYYSIFSVIPQITTAAATRNIERTRKLVANISGKARTIHRFSLLNEEMARTVFESFTPIELLQVELIPQYEEAPGFGGFVSSGHAYENQEKKIGEDQNILELNKNNDNGQNPHNQNDAGTISAIDGFCVNFCEKSVYLFTPVKSDSNNPNGIHIFEKVYFEDGNDFENKLQYLIDKYMINSIGNEDILRFYDYFKVKEIDGESYLLSEYGGEKLNLSKEIDGIKGILEKIVALISESSYNKLDIADKIYRDFNVRPEVTFNVINQLWKNGYIVEKYLL